MKKLSYKIQRALHIKPKLLPCRTCGNPPQIRTEYIKSFSSAKIEQLRKENPFIRVARSPRISEGDSHYVTVLGCKKCNRSIFSASPDRDSSRYKAFGIWNDEESYQLLYPSYR